MVVPVVGKGIMFSTVTHEIPLKPSTKSADVAFVETPFIQNESCVGLTTGAVSTTSFVASNFNEGIALPLLLALV